MAGDTSDIVFAEADIDEAPLTAADVLKKLEVAWMNEKLSPDILAHQTDVIDCMFEQMAEMERNLAKLKKPDLKNAIHRLEIDRIRYLISSYLKVRLTKIETFCANVLDREKILINTDMSPRLSAEEMQFAKGYFTIVDEHLKSVALSHMPPNMRVLDNLELMPKPNLDSYVFVRANRTVEGVSLQQDGANREEFIDFDEGSQHLLQFSSIVNLLNDGAVSMI